MTEKNILSKWKVTTKLCNECQKWDLFCIGEAHDYFLRSKSRQMMDRGEENAFFTEVQIIWGVPDNFESYYLSNDHSLISNYRMSHCMILGQLLNLISPTKINISEPRLEF